MSARDSESGSSTYKGGSGSAGGLGNGGIGGGMGGGGNYGGGGGGGAGRNGGINSRTGLTTGNVWKGVAGRNGVSVRGRPGGKAWNPGAWGMWGSPRISQGPLSGIPRRPGVPAPAAIPGVNPVPENVPPANPLPPDFYDWRPPADFYEVTQPPATFGPRVAPSGYDWTEPYRADSFYNDPRHGFPNRYTPGDSYNPGSRGPGQRGW